MKIIKTKGIVLLENNSGDYDKMLTVLTPGLGKINCIAKGARRPKSLLMAGSQFLCFGEYILYKGKDVYSINSCEPIEFFYNIRTDLKLYEASVYVSKIIKDVTTEGENSFRILQLFLNTVYIICENKKDLDLVLIAFRLRLMSIIGFRPNIDKCTGCGEKEKLNYFSFRDNGFKCENCGKVDKGSMKISLTTVTAIKFICSVPAKQVFSFNVPEESKKELEILSKIYLNEKLEKKYI